MRGVRELEGRAGQTERSEGNAANERNHDRCNREKGHKQQSAFRAAVPGLRRARQEMIAKLADGAAASGTAGQKKEEAGEADCVREDAREVLAVDEPGSHLRDRGDCENQRSCSRV
ncbi:MAG: hypothetical protein NTU53_23130 [Planctomycetota bacterium]|nr:hypothetical protein [Planctomycetota bacterium]